MFINKIVTIATSDLYQQLNTFQNKKIFKLYNIPNYLQIPNMEQLKMQQLK